MDFFPQHDDGHDDPLAAHAAEDPVPDTEAYAAAYEQGSVLARRSVPFARLLLSNCGAEITEHYVDEFAARYARMFLMVFVDTAP